SGWQRCSQRGLLPHFQSGGISRPVLRSSAMSCAMSVERCNAASVIITKKRTGLNSLAMAPDRDNHRDCLDGNTYGNAITLRQRSHEECNSRVTGLLPYCVWKQ